MNLFTIDIRFENDVVIARQKTRAIAAALKFDPQDQIRIATAVSEIARNTFQYGGGGAAEFRIDDSARMLVVTLRDKGKGIHNLDEIMAGKYVSQTGMGLGIVGAKRLMDDFQIETRPGGTTVLLGKRIPIQASRVAPAELNKALAIIERASQDPYDELKQQNKDLLNTLEMLRAKQEELAQLNRELDETNRGVVALYAELNEKADFLQHASELKTRFLSNMSHEFRTPLNSIMALSQILLDRLDGDLSPEQDRQVRYICNSAKDLTELVNDLLDVSKIEDGKLQLDIEEFNLVELVSETVELIGHSSPKHQLILENETPECRIRSDERRIEQVLINLLTNASKYSPGADKVNIMLDCGTEAVKIGIRDFGNGIHADKLPHIFSRFYRVDDANPNIPGLGLGF